MRATMLAFSVWALLAAPCAALAAPTCQDKNGETFKCGTPGAMPVGWTPSPQQLWERQISRPPASDRTELLKAICAIGLFFALIALMPEFDGTRAADWDRQEDDDDPRR